MAAPFDAWGRPWGDLSYGHHPEVPGNTPGVDYWGRHWQHPAFGQDPSTFGYTGQDGANPYGYAAETLPGAGPTTPDHGKVPHASGAAEGANPGLPGVFEPARKAVGRTPSWGTGVQGLDVQLLPGKTRDKMAQAIHYYQAPNKLQFLDAPNLVGQATLEGPLLDMRPDLRNVGPGNRPEISIPIWRESAFGQGIYLFIKIHGPIATITARLRVFSIQFGDPGREDLVTRLQAPEEITPEFFDGGNGVILSWPTPLYRFWQVKLRFDQLDGVRGVLGPANGLAYSVAVY